MKALGCVFVVINADKELYAADGFRWGWTKEVSKSWLFRSREEAEECVRIRTEKWSKKPLKVIQLILVVSEDIAEEKQVG